jgi:hypothetical protein
MEPCGTYREVSDEELEHFARFLEEQTSIVRLLQESREKKEIVAEKYFKELGDLNADEL